MNVASAGHCNLGRQALSIGLVFGIWFSPVPAGLTREAWQLFAVFAGAIFSVIVNAFPLLTASLLAVGAVVLTGTAAVLFTLYVALVYVHLGGTWETLRRQLYRAENFLGNVLGLPAGLT